MKNKFVKTNKKYKIISRIPPLSGFVVPAGFEPAKS